MLISRARQAAINKRDKMSSKSLPKDAQVMTAILKEMGVNEHDPRLINQMLEFTYSVNQPPPPPQWQHKQVNFYKITIPESGYVTDILDDAKVYSNHANKKNIDSEDVKLALQCRLDHSFTTPPPRDLLMDVARHKNTTPLPLIKPYTGPKLPPDRYCLSSANYKLKTLKKPRVQLQSGTTLVTTPRFSLQQPGRGVQLVSRQVSQPSVAIRSSTPSSAMPIIRVTPGATPASSSANESATNPLKRKLEDDDYDN